jgi:hypothetical protein
LEKQRNDDYQVAQLTKENVPTAPIVMGTDGGMNRVFASRLAETNPVFDNDGRLHAPPIHPGMSAPTLSGPREDPEAGMVKTASSAQKPAVFGSLFDAKTASQSNQVASTDGGSSEGFFAKLFKPKDTAAQQPAPQGVVLAGLRPAPEPRKIEAPKIEAPKSEVAKTEHPDVQKPETTTAAAAKIPAKPSQEANAYAPPATGSLMKGAQPVVSSGSFEGRWAGLQ